MSSRGAATNHRMGLVVLLYSVFLLYLGETKEASTEPPVFVETGKDLILDVKEKVTLEEGHDLTWSVNDSKNIVKFIFEIPNFFGIYKGRADFSVQDYSLLLKNVQQSDSGDYTALVSGDKKKLVAEYKVTVQDPVSPVKLTVNSSSSCNVTVTCSTVDSHISSTFRCDNQNCSEEGGEKSGAKTGPSSINVYVEHGFIICNHSNQVSWKQDKKEIKHFCQPGPETPRPNSAVWVTAVGGGAGGVALVVGAALVAFYIKYKKKNSSTIYEVPQDVKTSRTLIESPTEDSSGLSPTSTYCLVQFHTGPTESSKTKNNPQPETIYAQVNRAAMTNCRSPKNQHPELEKN